MSCTSRDNCMDCKSFVTLSDAMDSRKTRMGKITDVQRTLLPFWFILWATFRVRRSVTATSRHRKQEPITFHLHRTSSPFRRWHASQPNNSMQLIMVSKHAGARTCDGPWTGLDVLLPTTAASMFWLSRRGQDKDKARRLWWDGVI